MREKELRLALICYGGISLAVYMHGITKEIWRLARASQAYHAGETPLSGSQAVYHALLEEIEQHSGLRLRVLIDIIAGASAGGINGVFLSQAISTGQSLEPLTQLWLDSADVEALIDPNQAPKTRFSKMWAMPLTWVAARRSGTSVDAMVEPATRAEVQAKLSHFIRSRWFEPPFGGELFTGLLLDALDAMAASERGPRLLPPGQPLDLFVTMTDFRGHPETLRLNSPPEVIETEHRLIASYGDHGNPRDTLAHPAELVYAARATSSFPGAFPPFTVAELDAVLRKREVNWPGRAAFLERVLPRHSAAHAAESAVLIDGSVLANAPFRPAIDALRERPARREIDRRFVYVDPQPGVKIHFGGTNVASPGFFQTIIGAISELPRQQPIRDNLDAIAERSRRIESMRAIIAGIRGEVETAVEALFGYTLFLDSPTTARLANWRARAQNAAAKAAGYSYAAYGRLKLAGVVDGIAQLLYHAGEEPGPERWQQVRSAVVSTISERGFDEMTSSFSGGVTKETVDFLRSYDLGFRIRRLRMLARRLSELEAEHESPDLEPIREAIYLSLADYLECKRTERHSHLRKDVRKLRGDAGPSSTSSSCRSISRASTPRPSNVSPPHSKVCRAR